MKNILLIIIISLAGFYNVQAIDNKSLLDSAANYYSNNQFEKAIAAYEQILKNGYEASELYYNLGNAYFKSNKIALAIVNYERANKMAPGDEDILFNLNMANTFIVDKMEMMPEFFLNSWRSGFGRLLTPNQWAFLSLMVFIGALGLILVFFLSGKTLLRKISFWSGILLLSLTLVTFTTARKQKWILVHEPEAVVVTPSVVVKSAPAETGTELFLIHEGLKVKITDELGGWSQIKISNGNKGWIKQTDVVVI